MTTRTILVITTTILINVNGILAQSSSNIGDFVGQLTSLINQGGALAQGLQGAGYGSPGSNYPSGGQLPGGYPNQYAGGPQGGGGYGFPSGPPPGGLPPGGQPPPFSGGYSPTSLYGALASISQYDDLRCVPRLLCEVAAGARPGSAYTQSSSSTGSIPFLSKDAIITLLTVLNFVDDSPLLVFGRAAVLGYTARGDPRQCLIAYPTCPRDPDKLVDYLNNHNGGFFRFFNQQIPQYAPQYQYYQQPPYPQYPGGSPPYPPPPYYQSGQQYPQQYPGYQQYPQRPIPPPNRYPQRPYRKYPPYYQQQGRIQNRPQGNEYDYLTSEGGTSKLIFSSNLDASQYYQETNNQPQSNYNENKFSDYTKYNDGNNYNSITGITNGKFAFPTEPPSSPAPSVIPLPPTASSVPSLDSTGSYSHKNVRRGKTLAFPNGEPSNQPVKTSGSSSTMVFPDRTGTGDLRLDLDEFGAYKTVHFASEVVTERPQPGNIFRGQRDIFTLRFPDGRSSYEDSIRLVSQAEDYQAPRNGEEESQLYTMASPNESNT